MGTCSRCIEARVPLEYHELPFLIQELQRIESSCDVTLSIVGGPTLVVMGLTTAVCQLALEQLSSVLGRPDIMEVQSARGTPLYERNKSSSKGDEEEAGENKLIACRGNAETNAKRGQGSEYAEPIATGEGVSVQNTAEEADVPCLAHSTKKESKTNRTEGSSKCCAVM